MKKRRNLSIPFSFLFAAIFACSMLTIAAESDGASVKSNNLNYVAERCTILHCWAVNVRDGSNNPIAGATVYISENGNTVYGPAATNSAGQVCFDPGGGGLTPAGNYVVHVSKTCYRPVNKPVTLTQPTASPVTDVIMAYLCED